MQLQNVSLRMLHSSKQNRFQRPLVRALQNTLRTTSLGQIFFKQVASAKVRPSVSCYIHKDLWVAAVPCMPIAVGMLLSGCCLVKSSRG